MQGPTLQTVLVKPLSIQQLFWVTTAFPAVGPVQRTPHALLLGLHSFTTSFSFEPSSLVMHFIDLVAEIKLCYFKNSFKNIAIGVNIEQDGIIKIMEMYKIVCLSFNICFAYTHEYIA